MCHRVKCSKCGKPTWSGCGMHVEDALRGVPKAERCRCGEKSANAPAGAASASQPWWARIGR